jgi:probable rRNA maturation factor
MSSKEPVVLFRRAPVRPGRRALEQFACRLRNRVAEGREFTCLITTNGELRRLNREFLGRDYATDVLSFPSNGPGGAGASLGEIAISAQKAAQQARRFGHSVEDEIRILMLHGVLHLTGMDHERDAGRMARAEAVWRQELGLPAGLIERARA